MQYSIVNYNKLLIDSSYFRIDADFYKPEFLFLESLKEAMQLKELATITDGDHSKFPENQKQEVCYLRAKDLKNNVINDDDPIFISRDYFNKQKRSWITEDNILMSIMGSVGEIAVTPKVFKPCLANRAISIIKKIKINPYYLFIFLLTKYGFNQITRFKAGGVQERINLEDLEKIKIVKLSVLFQELIGKIIGVRFKYFNLAKDKYSQAEQLLLSELGLLDWKPEHELAFVKNFSDTKKTDRIDAEFFQPKYEEIMETVKKYKGGADTIKGQFKLNKKSFRIINDKQYRYIEIGCVNISDGSMEPIVLKGIELPANAKINFLKNDVIVSKVRPYRGAVGIVDCDDYVGSGAFTVLQENGTVNKETLMVFLRLKPLLDFSLKFNTGTSYPTITDEDILNFPLPKIVSEIQNQIKEKIIEMHFTKSLSKPLLEIAKLGVEMAIEKDEEEAGGWINSEIKKLEIIL